MARKSRRGHQENSHGAIAIKYLIPKSDFKDTIELLANKPEV